MPTLLLTLLACGGPVVAPAEVEVLAPFLFTEWDNEDPEVLEAGLVNLLAYAETLDLTAKAEDRAFTLAGGIDRAEVEAYVHHDLDPQDTDAVGLFYQSPHAVSDHLRHVALTDRTMVEPSSPDIYVREWISGDVDCLVSDACEIINALNDVERKNFLFQLRFDLDKYWRWVLTPDGERALFARSVNLDSTDNDGNITLLQGYSVDVFVPRDGGTLRFQAAWQRTEVPGIDDDQMSGVLSDGIDDAFVLMDEWLTENP